MNLIRIIENKLFVNKRKKVPKEIIKEMERVGKLYKRSQDNQLRKSYDTYIETMVFHKSKGMEKYLLNNYWDYWERLIR